MSIMDRYKEINASSWNTRVGIHLESEFYDNESFIAGRNSLPEVDQALLRDRIQGKSVLHLQCHFGQDTISLERLGASNVVGVDMSSEGIRVARELASKTKSRARFIQSDVYDLPAVLDEQFDIVYTSYGTIAWLPDLDLWASVIHRFLKPGGSFVFAEFHPVVWMMDDNFQKIDYHYFNKKEIHSVDEGSYAGESSEDIEYVVWNHSLSEVIGALLKQGLELKHFEEYDYSPYKCFAPAVEVAPQKYRIDHLDDKIPMMYTLIMAKK